MNLQRLLPYATTCVATIVLVVVLLNFSNAQDQTEEASEQSSSQE